ncbi:sensor histidine kinase [Poseidonibacter antarcticus]|uniref:sensor histidine kinase n=1 Tax=Poseidonibacter antarcticus TaxID=2478538 RepID=UPI000EF546A5|nr:ABC transporter substrate binding protein [Poseidonibacter antarcticus]
MKKLILISILFTTFLFANSSILIINSYHKGYAWSDNIIKGIERTLYKYPSIDINILYMDSKRITSSLYYEKLKDLYKVQLKNRKYDLVLTIDRFAYDFVTKNYNNFFINENILSVGNENFDKKKLIKYNLENKVSALLEKRDLKTNIKLIEKIIPNIEKIYIINDKSQNAKHTEPLIKNLFDNFKGKYKLIYLREDNLENLKNKFSKFDKNTALLFIRFYKNSNGELNNNQEIALFIKNANVPIFITDSIFNKKGALGGKIIELEKFGNTAGEMAFDILKNKSQIIKISNDFSYVFDASKLNEFSLSLNQINENYKIVNKQMTFFDKNRGFINFVFTISPFLIVLIIVLLHSMYLRKNTERKLKQRMEFDNVLLNAIESPIFWQDDKGIIIDSNAKFCNFINVTMKKVYWNKLSDFKNNKSIQIYQALENFKLDKEKNNQFSFEISKNDIKTFFIKQANYCDSKTKKTGTVTIFTDVTKEKQIEEEKKKNEEFIIQQSKLAELGEIFSSIAHQWKSPLVEITTIAQESFYNNKVNTNLREDESYVKDIMTQVNYMTNTINDFQEFIKPSNKEQTFNIIETINSMLEIVSHNIKYNYINIKIDVKENTNLNVNGFRNEFMQSFLNIINNAKDELLKIDIKNRNINIFIYNINKQLIIKINDNAGGINIKNINDIFKVYYSTKENGHGIGLYMAKMIIEDKMNGKLNVQNLKDGASFEIILDNA